VAEPTSATIRYFAAARAAAGTAQEQFTLSGGATVALLLTAAVDVHGPELAKVLPRCSYLLDAVAVRDTATPISAGQVLDILPPFAGG
jgi:molybdopterin synthase sulfur carrier subunit